MTSSTKFERAIKLVVSTEGGYSDHAWDNGGATRFGVTEVIARKWGWVGAMRDLPWELARDIYLKDYWMPIRGDELPWPWALCIFDCAVNQGVGTAIRLAQDAVGVMVDGMFGPRTLAAIKNADDRMLARFMAQRAMRYAKHEDYPIAGYGWFTRLFVRAFEAGKDGNGYPIPS